MEVLIADKMQKVCTITQKKLKELLKDGGNRKNIFIYGKSGIGKSAIVEEYALENGLKVIVFSLATEMPEAMGGIPHLSANKEDSFTRLLDIRLAPLFETKGQGYVLFFDEMNQAVPEVLNSCYSICHPDPKKRHWNGHSLEFAQIVGAGNLSTGEDGTVYLNDIPTPLHNRFHIFEMVAKDQDTSEYLQEKYKNIPQVSEYINILLDEKIPPRDIDDILDTIAYENDPYWIAAKVQEPLAQKLMDIKKRVATVDPAKALKGARMAYKQFKEQGFVKWTKTEIIKTEEELIEKLKVIITEEELKSILNGEEE